MKVLVVGLVNMETNLNIGEFPIYYQPIEFAFFKTKTAPSGVGLNLSLAFQALGDDVSLYSLGADDSLNKAIVDYLDDCKLNYHFEKNLKETPESLVLYDNQGKRKIYCDLKDCQEKALSKIEEEKFDLACLTNINFSRPYLKKYKNQGVKIACDCHVLTDIYDEFNRDFLEYSDILFISDEGIRDRYYSFMQDLIKEYDKDIIVISRGAQGTLMYVKKDGTITFHEAYPCQKIVNTCGAGDCLFSAFNHYYLKTSDPYYSINMAMKYASKKIEYSGGALGFMKEKEFEES